MTSKTYRRRKRRLLGGLALGLAVAAIAAPTALADGRSPDTRDAAYVAHEPVVVVNESGFDWGDAGIGFGAAFGLALLALATGFGLRRNGRPGMSIGQPA